MIRDLKTVWSRSSDTELSGTSANLVAVLLLALMAALAGGAALRESVTIDEVAHIGAGVSYVQKLDLRMNAEHPPLPKVLAALPLMICGVHADYTTRRGVSVKNSFQPTWDSGYSGNGCWKGGMCQSRCSCGRGCPCCY